LYQPRARGPHPEWEPTLYQPGARGLHPEKWQNDIWYKWEPTLYQLGGQRIASREITKQSRIQTQIWSPTLNTERHGIIIAQIWIKILNYIKNSKNIILIKRKTLWHGRTHQMTGSVDNQQANVCSVYIDQGECNPLVWLYKTISDWDHPARLSALPYI
jgi:hypothetical protein